MKIPIDKVGNLQTYFAGIGVVLLTLYIENRQSFHFHQSADNFHGNWMPSLLQACVNTAVSIPFVRCVKDGLYFRTKVLVFVWLVQTSSLDNNSCFLTYAELRGVLLAGIYL